MKSKRAFLVLGFAVVTLTIHTTAQAERVRRGEYRFVGFSEALFQGNGGISAMHTACQATFGDLARMCTSEEIFKSLNLPQELDQTGWVQPIVTGAGFNSVNGEELIVDAYKATLSFSTTQSCNGWTSNNVQLVGLVYYPRAGALTNSLCVNENPVACCAPRNSRNRKPLDMEK